MSKLRQLLFFRSFSAHFLFCDEENTELGSRLGSERPELNDTKKRMPELIEIDLRIPISQISQKMGYNTAGIEKKIDFLNENGYLIRRGKTSAGYWGRII